MRADQEHMLELENRVTALADDKLRLLNMLRLAIKELRALDARTVPALAEELLSELELLNR